MDKNRPPKVLTKKHMARLERERMQNRYIVTAAAAVLIVVLALITYGVLDQNVFAYNRAVAKVGDDKISVAEFEDQVRITRQQLILQFQQYQQLAVFFGDDSMARQVAAQLENNQTANEQVGEQALTYLIDTKLIRQEAERRGITVSQEEIDARMRDWFGYYPDGTPTVEPTVTVWPTSTLSAQQMTLVPPTATPTATVEPTLDPTAAAAAPTEAATPTEVVEPTSALPTPTALNPDPTTTPMPTPTPLTEQGYRDRIQDALEPFKGKRVDEGDLRRLVENSLYSEKLINELTVDIKQDQEMVWARHILVEDEATAQQVLTELKNGGDFAQLASQYSSDGSKDQGGDLDWFPRGQMVKEFEDVAFSLEIGQISDPVQSQFGFHIIQVLGHEVRQLSAEQLDQLKRNAYDKWLEEARANTTIERYDEVWKERIPTDPSLEEALAAQQQEQQGQPGQQ